MAVYANARIVTANKIFSKGEKLNGVSENEQKILVRQGFAHSDDEFNDDFGDDDYNADPDKNGFTGDDDFTNDGLVLLSEEELRKLKKADIVEYASKFKLVLTEESSKEELLAAVLNFIEENSAE